MGNNKAANSTLSLGISALIGLTALVIGFGISSWLPAATGNTTEAENRQLQQQLRKLNQEIEILQAQIGDYQTLEQIQQEMITELKEGNQGMQNKLAEMDKRLQSYREVINSR